MPPETNIRAAIIGGGPAGLMAAETLAAAGLSVDLFDAMPSVGRKFLLAGKGGLNITHSEPFSEFLKRYGNALTDLEPALAAFGPEAIRHWMHALGIESFIGSSGRVFPKEMKAAPLLRAWLHRLRQAGVRLHVRHRWLGWHDDGRLRFATPDGERIVHAQATILALGGGSWPQLGSDGAWQAWLADAGVELAPLQPANCGFEADWTPLFRNKFAGQPVKSITAAPNGHALRRGEFLVSASGLEGSLIYAFSAPLRAAIARGGSATLWIDLLPDHSPERVLAEVSRPRGARSLSSHLQSRLGIKGIKSGLLHECLPAEQFRNPAALASAIKRLPLKLIAPRPLSEAISSAGGVRFAAVDPQLMLRQIPGVFCAGEMLDWEAPTGGYLLSACLATGRHAARGALVWLDTQA